MATPSNLVIGGVSVPRVYVCGSNLLTGSSVSFEDGVGSWTTFPAGTTQIQQYAAGNTTFYGEYVLSVQDNSASLAQGGQISASYGSAVGGKTFVLTFFDFAMTAHTYTAQVEAGLASPALNADNYATATQARRCHVFTVGSTASQTTLTIKIYGTDDADVANQGTVFIDEVELREVEFTWTGQYEFHKKKYAWERKIQAAYELIGGEEKEFVLGYRFFTSWGYDWNDTTDEQARARIASGSHLIVYPSIDKTYSVDCRWDGDYARDFPEDVFVGHKGEMPLRGIRLEKIIPYAYVNA